jgi:flagellar protein FlaG
MSAQNINSAVPARGVTNEGAPMPAAAHKSRAATAELPEVAIKGAPSTEQLKHLVDNANKAMDKASSKLEFTVDNATNKTIVKVTEAQSGKVIMQFPSEEMLSITRAIDHAQNGVLLKTKA